MDILMAAIFSHEDGSPRHAFTPPIRGADVPTYGFGMTST
jgi:hypothetical protein